MTQIALAALVSALLIAVTHWFPWRVLLHRELHRVEAYAAGLIAILLPGLTLLALWAEYMAMAVIIACTIAAGLTTLIAKSIDKVAEHRNELHDRRHRDQL